MVQRPRRTACRTKLGKRMQVRIPPTSHSLRQVLLAVCKNQEVPLPTLHQLNGRILASNTDVQNWDALTSTVLRQHVLHALACVCSQAQTGPVTAFVIHKLAADANYQQWERAEALRNATRVELVRQRSGQAFLAACEWFL